MSGPEKKGAYPTAHLYQRGKKGIWYAKFYRDGKQVLRSLKTTNYRLARNEALLSSSG